MTAEVSRITGEAALVVQILVREERLRLRGAAGPDGEESLRHPLTTGRVTFERLAKRLAHGTRGRGVPPLGQPAGQDVHLGILDVQRRHDAILPSSSTVADDRDSRPSPPTGGPCNAADRPRMRVVTLIVVGPTPS
ncbi:hypothetical protein GCM10025883_39970 [Mobilicoccus caccae]|uniref:Uncharacterized protein n=1 Tax=Mobilicoccus caccae TaxID=1859295 RepID=A0ABQ6IVM3_9MICO|nr:hypothetical protein GCM10025883_39970 [Mobilicoccus caccae]